MMCEQHHYQTQHRDGLPDWVSPSGPAGVVGEKHVEVPIYFAWQERKDRDVTNEELGKSSANQVCAYAYKRCAHVVGTCTGMIEGFDMSGAWQKEEQVMEAQPTETTPVVGTGGSVEEKVELAPAVDDDAVVEKDRQHATKVEEGAVHEVSCCERSICEWEGELMHILGLGRNAAGPTESEGRRVAGTDARVPRETRTYSEHWFWICPRPDPK